MKGVEIISADQMEPSAWANGQGTTRTLLTASAGDVPWRVALATIEKSCDFSSYEDTQRWLAVVAGGEGIHLAFSDRQVALHRGGAGLLFAGTPAPACLLLTTAVLALNVMWHRSMTALPPVPVAGHHTLAPHELLFCVTAARIVMDEAEWKVPALSLLRHLGSPVRAQVDAAQAYAWSWGAKV